MSKINFKLILLIGVAVCSLGNLIGCDNYTYKNKKEAVCVIAMGLGNREHLSRAQVKANLINEGFSEEEVKYIIDNSKVNWRGNAKKYVRDNEDNYKSKRELSYYLLSQGYRGDEINDAYEYRE